MRPTGVPRSNEIYLGNSVKFRFHVSKLYNQMLTELRRELYREARTQLERDVLKGTRWLLLKRLDNLDESRNEPGRLLQALRLSNRTPQPLQARWVCSGVVWRQSRRRSISWRAA